MSLPELFARRTRAQLPMRNHPQEVLLSLDDRWLQFHIVYSFSEQNGSEPHFRLDSGSGAPRIVLCSLCERKRHCGLDSMTEPVGAWSIVMMERSGDEPNFAVNSGLTC